MVFESTYILTLNIYDIIIMPYAAAHGPHAEPPLLVYTERKCT